MTGSNNSSSQSYRILLRQLERLPSDTQSLLLVASYVLAGLALDEVASIFETPERINAWYPPAGLHIVLLLRFSLRYIPELLFIPLLDGLVVTPQGVTPLYVLICALYTMIGYGTGCALLLHKLHIDRNLRRFRDVLWLIAVVLIASLTVALCCDTTLVQAGYLSWSKWGTRVLHHWAGDATGIAMLAPPLLLLLRVPQEANSPSGQQPVQQINQRWFKWREVLEWSLEFSAVVAVSWGAYGLPPAQGLDYTYFIFLPIIWIAMRHGFKRAALAVLLLNISVAICVGTKFGESNALALQFGLVTVSYTGLLVGGVVTEYKQALVRIQEQIRREKLLNQMGRVLNSSFDPDYVLQEIVELTGNRFGVERVLIFSVDTERVQALSEWRASNEVVSLLSLNQPLSEWADLIDPTSNFSLHQVFHAPKYIDFPHPRSRIALIQQARILSVLRVPVLIRGQIFGGIALHTTTTYRVFTPDEIQLLERIADQAAIALYNAQSYERLEELVIERTQALEEEKLCSETANLAKSEFLANMGHELRSPLTSILGFSSVLLQQIYGSLDDKQQQYIAAINSSGQHLLKLIDDLLDLSKVEAGKEDLTLEILQVEEVCQECLVLIQERAHNQNLQISVEIAPDITTCVADRRRLKQILINLLSNAVKFTEAGSVTLRVTSSVTIQFAVIDTGIGIAETDQAVLFQPFCQLDSGLNRKYDGTGLGLALSQRLARLHGGDITVESELGHGSCFTLHLPFSPPGWELTDDTTSATDE